MEQIQAHVAQYKKDLVSNLVNLINQYPIIGVVNMENLPAPQLQVMRAQLRGSFFITMTKRRLMKLAIEQTKSKKNGIEKLEAHLGGMPALIFTKENPFKLSKTLQKNNVIRPGDEIDTGRDHRGGVNQGAYRSWPLHRVGQPDVERDLRRLSRSADKEEERDQGHLLRPEEMGASLQCRKINTPDPLTAHFPDEEQDAQEKAEIADPVNNKSLVAGYSIRVILVPEANQEVRAEPHALPADKEEQEIIGHDQHQHKKDKEVEIGEVAHHPLVMAHVSERIDVNQQADAADDQKHDRAQGVDLEGNLRLKRSRLDPGKERIPETSGRREKNENPQGKEKREPHGDAGQAACIPSSQPRPEKNVQRGP